MLREGPALLGTLTGVSWRPSTGLALAFGGYALFSAVDVKGDLGALVVGAMLASHPLAGEVSKRLLGFKDLLLVGFFLSIGMSGDLTASAIAIALLLAALVVFKVVLFFALFTRFKMRARTATLSSLTLANYSEFGLIVGSVGVAAGWIDAQWLVMIAIALSVTFILAAPLNSAAHPLYARYAERLKTFETATRLPEDAPIAAGGARVVVIGMGGVGTSAYDEMRRRHGEVVMGVDFCAETVDKHRGLGRSVVYGDAEDSDFWERAEPAESRVEVVMMALPDPRSAVFAIRQLRQRGFQGQVTASVRYEDEMRFLEREGVDAVYSLYEEAGVGFADHVCDHMGFCGLKGGGAADETQ